MNSKWAMNRTVQLMASPIVAIQLEVENTIDMVHLIEEVLTFVLNPVGISKKRRPLKHRRDW